MRKYLGALCLAAATGCGYIGAPLPPALNIPVAVKNVVAAQHGDQLVVGFVITGETTDGLVLHKLRAIELRAGPPAASMDAWARSARPIPIESTKIDGYEVKAPTAGLENQDVVIAVRAIGPTGRAGAWSAPLSVHVLPAPPKPVLRAESGPDGVVLSWPRENAPAGTKWRVYRQRKGEEKPVVIAEAPEPRWVDPAEENAELTYQIQTLQPAGQGVAQSELSNAVPVTYRDVFAPAIPVGLTVIAGVASVELSWEPNHEPDLRGYQVYRGETAGALAKLGAITQEVTFSDNKLEHGKRYTYAVSAVDRQGNESKPSPTVEVAVP